MIDDTAETTFTEDLSAENLSTACAEPGAGAPSRSRRFFLTTGATGIGGPSSSA